jgi:hypothetical protein
MPPCNDVGLKRHETPFTSHEYVANTSIANSTASNHFPNNLQIDTKKQPLFVAPSIIMNKNPFGKRFVL